MGKDYIRESDLVSYLAFIVGVEEIGEVSDRNIGDVNGYELQLQRLRTGKMVFSSSSVYHKFTRSTGVYSLDFSEFSNDLKQRDYRLDGITDTRDGIERLSLFRSLFIEEEEALQRIFLLHEPYINFRHYMKQRDELLIESLYIIGDSAASLHYDPTLTEGERLELYKELALRIIILKGHMSNRYCLISGKGLRGLTYKNIKRELG